LDLYELESALPYERRILSPPLTKRALSFTLPVFHLICRE
jgi:hypothetical protein